MSSASTLPSYETVQEQIRGRPRRWLVTGAAGFIGSHLAEHLLKLEQEVVGLDNFSTGKRANLDQVKLALSASRWRRFRFIEGDIRSPESCADACRGADVVLHHAALGSVPLSLRDPIATHHSNVTGFVNLLLAARDAGAGRFVYASSSAAYGDHAGVPSVEDATGRALSPYGLSKQVDELYAGVFARCYALPCVGLRYFNVFGPRQDPEGAYAAVIPAWIGAMLRGRQVHINGDGKSTRDFCHVDNVVQANLLAALVQEPAALDQAYNIAVGEATSLNVLFELIRSLLEPRLPRLRGLRPHYRPFREGDIAFSTADCAKAARLLGYRPRWRVDEGLARTVEWYAAQLPVSAGGAGRSRAMSKQPTRDGSRP